MIILILVLGFLLRLIALNQSLWLDEAISAFAVKNFTSVQLITKFAVGDFHPPLYYLLLKLWTDIFGYSEIALRMPSVIAGVLTLPAVYLVSRKWFGERVALLSALFLAINPLAVYYSQEARMYALAMMLIAWSFWAVTQKKLLWFGLFFALAIYTDYLPFFVWPVFVLIYRKNKLPWRYLLLPLGLFVFWLPMLLKQLSLGSSVSTNLPAWGAILGGFSLKSLPLTLVKFIVGRITIDDKKLYYVIFGSVSLIYLYILARARSFVLWCWLLIPLFLGLVCSVFLPIFSYFRFLFILPAFSLLLAVGLVKNKLLILAVTLVSLISLSVFDSTSQFQRENWRDLVRYIQVDPGYVVIPSLAQAAVLRYYGPNLKVNDLTDLNIPNTGKIYLLRYVQEIFDPKDLEKKAIEEKKFVKTNEKSFNGVLVWVYFK